MLAASVDANRLNRHGIENKVFTEQGEALLPIPEPIRDLS